MIMLGKDLSKVYPEVDIVTTPDGSPVAMVLANNCSSDINAWLNLFREFYETMRQKLDINQIFNVLFNKALEADADGGGLLSYVIILARTLQVLKKVVLYSSVLLKVDSILPTL